MYTQYTKDSSNIIRFSGESENLDKLPAGVYSIRIDNLSGFYLMEEKINCDDIIQLPGSPAEVINKKVDDFLSQKVKDSFDKYGILYKRGILMFGPPGTGKTSIINILIKTAIEKNMVVFLGPTPDFIPEVISIIRSIEKNNRPIMVIWEELEKWMLSHEGEILNLLDGMYQVDNIFYIATTNYIDKIPYRIKNRPSRFAEVIEIGLPDRELRREFLLAKIHKTDDINIDEWVDKTEGLTIDHLKDLIISVLVLGLSVDDAVEKLLSLPDETEEYNEMKEMIDGIPLGPPRGKKCRPMTKTIVSTRQTGDFDDQY